MSISCGVRASAPARTSSAVVPVIGTITLGGPSPSTTSLSRTVLMVIGPPLLSGAQAFALTDSIARKIERWRRKTKTAVAKAITLNATASHTTFV